MCISEIKILDFYILFSNYCWYLWTRPLGSGCGNHDMEVATVQSIILSLSVTLLLLVGGQTKLLSSNNVSSGRELLLRSLVTILIILSVVFNVVQCNAIQSSNDQRTVVFVSMVAAIIVDFFNRSGSGVPCCQALATVQRKANDKHENKSILRPNVGSLLITSARNNAMVGTPGKIHSMLQEPQQH